MKKLTALAGLLLVATFAAAQTATVLSGPFDEALAKAQKENKLVLIDTFLEWLRGLQTAGSAVGQEAGAGAFTYCSYLGLL